MKYPWTGHLLWQLSHLLQNFLTTLLVWISKPVVSCIEEEVMLLLVFYYCIWDFPCCCCKFKPFLCRLSPFHLCYMYVAVSRPCRLSEYSTLTRPWYFMATQRYEMSLHELKNIEQASPVNMLVFFNTWWEIMFCIFKWPWLSPSQPLIFFIWQVLEFTSTCYSAW